MTIGHHHNAYVVQPESAQGGDSIEERSSDGSGMELPPELLEAMNVMFGGEIQFTEYWLNYRRPIEDRLAGLSETPPLLLESDGQVKMESAGWGVTVTVFSRLHQGLERGKMVPEVTVIGIKLPEGAAPEGMPDGFVTAAANAHVFLTRFFSPP